MTGVANSYIDVPSISMLLYRNISDFSGEFTCRPLSEQSHQPSLPPVFCSSTVSKSPRRNASSSGDSAMLSYNARAMHYNKY